MADQRAKQEQFTYKEVNSFFIRPFSIFKKI